MKPQKGEYEMMISGSFLTLFFPPLRERTLTAQTIISFEATQVPEEEDEEETGSVTVRSSSHDLHSCQGDTDNAWWEKASQCQDHTTTQQEHLDVWLVISKEGTTVDIIVVWGLTVIRAYL